MTVPAESGLPTPAPAAPEPPATPSPTSEKGFPEGTPLAEMSDSQRAAYWQHYARKHEDTVKAFNGLTPQQVKDLQAKNEELEAKSLSADEKALKQATKEAGEAARKEAAAQYLPQIQALQVKSIASSVIQGDKLNAFIALANPSACLGDDGQVDESKVMGYLTAMYGEPEKPSNNQRWQNFGQFAPPPPAGKPGSLGKAEAEKRFGTKKPT